MCTPSARLPFPCRGPRIALAPEMPPPISQGLNSRRNWAFYLLSTTILAPIEEELLYRGFLLPSLALWMPPWAAVAVSSLLFAVSHTNWTALHIYWLGGCVFGWAYASTGNLLAPIMLHAFLNLLNCARTRLLQIQHSVPASPA